LFSRVRIPAFSASYAFSIDIKHLSDALFHFFLSTFNNSELKDENISLWPLIVLHMIYIQLEIEPTGKVKE
jgi:hypothetical protein